MPDNKTPALAAIILDHIQYPPSRVLVVGCGDGIEARLLGQTFNASVTGIDVKDAFDCEAARHVRLQVGDATALEFDDHSFDFVYSYHALEHIPDYRTALREMNRVLAPGGSWCVGTPNRSRLIGYIGSKHLVFQEKIRWNLDDWRMRLKGKFRNEYGAHAGFTSNELSAELTRAFGSARDITLEYYRAIYSRHRRKIDLLARSGAGRFLLPSVYFLGSR